MKSNTNQASFCLFTIFKKHVLKHQATNPIESKINTIVANVNKRRFQNEQKRHKSARIKCEL